MNLDALTKSILKLSLSHNQEQMHFLRGEVLDMPEYYLPAGKGVSQEEWKSGNCPIFIDQNGTLAVFLSESEAAAFAARQGCVLPSGEYPIVCKDNEAFVQLVASYEERISKIKIYTRTPIHLEFSPGDFHRDGAVPVPAPTEPRMSTRTFKGVEEVKKALETYEANARRKLDPGTRYEHLSTLIQTLAQQNELDPADLDRILDLPSGYSRGFFNNGVTANPSVDVMKRYLSYFGLENYLYLYKKDSRELLRYLGAHKFIDKYSLRRSPSPSAERFKLDEINRMIDENNAFVYKLALSSDRGNKIEIAVSNSLTPAPLIVGREYQLMERGGRTRDVDEQPQKITNVSSLPNEDELAALVASLDGKSGLKSGKDKAPRSYEETRKDEIIKYFRKQGMDTRSATAKIRDLEVEDDILDEFYKYITKKQFGKLELFGYSARKLIKEMHMEPYEAYLSLVQLRSSPQETKQRLLYRERDPQYQRKPKEKGGGEE